MTLKLATAETEAEKPKRKRERIMYIETQPEDDWFVRTKTSRGRIVWYLRFRVTGLNPQLFGPFTSKRQSLLFLNDALDNVLDWGNELKDACEKRRMIEEECQSIWPPIIEHPVVAQANLQAKKGR